jgi:hypothetical protein
MRDMTVLEYLKATGGQMQPALRLESNDVPTALRLGLTVRDYFAGQALAALAPYTVGTVQPLAGDKLAAECYRVADEMIAQRRKLLEPDTGSGETD